MKYKVGDIVKIREDLTVGREYADSHGDTWVCEPEMERDVAKNNYIGTIVKACISINGQEQYTLDISNRPFFNDGMIEGYVCALQPTTDDILDILEV